MERVTAVIPQEGYRLLLTFDTGETELFDASRYLEEGPFVQLKNEELFKQAYVVYDTDCWPGNLDIAPETLYDRYRRLKTPSTMIDAVQAPPTNAPHRLSWHKSGNPLISPTTLTSRAPRGRRYRLR